MIEKRQEGAEDHDTRDAHTVCSGGACIVQKKILQKADMIRVRYARFCAHASYEHGGKAACAEGAQRAWRAQHGIRAADTVEYVGKRLKHDGGLS